MGNNENTNGTGNWLNPQRVRMILGILLVALILYVAWQNRETLFSGTDSTIGAETGTTELSVPSGDPSAASVKPTTATTAPTEKPTTAPTEKPTTAPTAKPTTAPTAAQPTTPSGRTVREDGQYDSKEEVALYIHLYGHLPSNYITKKDAEALGWPGGSLKNYAPGKCIGGDYFGNYEGLLPKKSGRQYTECDIDTMNKSSRGAKRIIFSNDGLVYYTDDHYESFELLYGND